jgi:hypothetical protein
MALKYLVDLDLGGNEIQNFAVQTLSTAPTTGLNAGRLYYDTNARGLFVHDGLDFVRVGLTADGTTITEANGIISVGTIAPAKVTGLTTYLTKLDGIEEGATNTADPAITTNGSTPSLATGITGAEVRLLIGAGTSSFSGSYNALSDVPTEFNPAYHEHHIVDITGLQDELNAKLDATDIDDYFTKAEVAAEIAKVVDSAPAALDTLNELAAALGDDPNFATSIATSIGTKLDASTYTAADILTKIKTVDGAGSGLDADLLDGQSSAYYLNYNNLTNKPTIPVFQEITITGNGSGTPLPLVVNGFLNIQIYELSSGRLVLTDIIQDGVNPPTAFLEPAVDYVITAVGA